MREYLFTLERQPKAITSHLICLPPPGAVATLKVAFLRDPIERIASAYRFQIKVQKSLEPVSFQDYLKTLQQSSLSNYQTRHLSPQEPSDWVLRRGWGARPELIDLGREDLFVGLVEHYDDSIVALEDQLERIGIPMDLAYSRPLNITRATVGGRAPISQEARLAHSPVGLAVTELDANLYRRAERRLQERLAAVSQLERKRADLLRRREVLNAYPPSVQLKPQAEWVNLPLHTA